MPGLRNLALVHESHLTIIELVPGNLAVMFGMATWWVLENHPLSLRRTDITYLNSDLDWAKRIKYRSSPENRDVISENGLPMI